MLAGLLREWANLRFVALLGLAMPSVAKADYIIDPVPGTISLSSGTYNRRNVGCGSVDPAYPVCDGSSWNGGNGPGLFFGSGGDLCDNSWGTITGIAHPSVTIDGVTLPGPALLPTGSYFYFGVGVGKAFCPSDGPAPWDCSGYSCSGAIYNVGGQSGVIDAGGRFFSIPATAASSGVDFSFQFCNRTIVFGTACGVAGSIGARWRLFTPARPFALQIPAAASGPQSMPGAGVSITYLSNPAGIVTATNVPQAPALPALPSTILPRHWELHSDMGAGTFDADLSLTYDLTEIPTGIFAGQLSVYTYDSSAAGWTSLATEIDSVANRATVHGLEHFSVFVLGTTALPTQRFVDVTSVVLGAPANGRSSAWGDYDGDGDLDLFISNFGQANQLFRNEGSGILTDVSGPPLNFTGQSYGVAWGDFDNDGDLDLYVTAYGQPNKLFRNDGGGLFTDVTSGPLGDAGNGEAVIWIDYDGDGDLDLFIGNFGGASKLLRNDGNGAFTDVTSGALGDPRALQSAACADYDNDGDLDLYLVNFYGASALLRNDGGGVFTNVTSGPLANAGHGTGVAWGDYDNDGDLDLYITNYYEANRLLRNDGGGVFTDVTSGPLGDTGHGFGVAWADYDNDGDLDLYFCNYGEPNRLLQNNGGGVFVDVTRSPVNFAGNGVGVTWTDYDGDGDPDLLVTNDGEGSRLFRNDLANGNHWLQVSLIGSVSNRSGIGARVRVLAEGKSQIREIGVGSSAGCQTSLKAEFGLGAATAIDSLIIRWPSGIVEYGSGLAADQRVTIHESSGAVDVARGGTEPLKLSLSPGSPNPFHSTTRISYVLPLTSPVRLGVFDQQGRLVRVLEKSAEQRPGSHEVLWDGRDQSGRELSTAIYFLRLETRRGELLGKVVLMR